MYSLGEGRQSVARFCSQCGAKLTGAGRFGAEFGAPAHAEDPTDPACAECRDGACPPGAGAWRGLGWEGL